MLLLAFLVLGLLVGNLAGLTSASVTLPLVAALFAFGGTSGVAFVEKLQVADRSMAARLILGLSVGCLVGVYTGILVREHRWLSPRVDSGTAGAAPAASLTDSSGGYLRRQTITEIQAIDQRLQNGLITVQSAYDSLHAVVLRRKAP
jgi:hypothetical protein